jgi:catechol 2,3-dioxygenase
MSDHLPEPIFDVAQLAHVELLTPKLDETLWFFKDLLGLQETERQGQSVYLRGYEESSHHSLKVTQAPEPGLGHVAWRASSPQALERRVESIERSGYGIGWADDEVGHGPAYRFATPDGHPMEIFWEVDYAEIPAGERSALLSRPQRRPAAGVPVRRIDHLNVLVQDVTLNKEFMLAHLGFRLREHIVLKDGSEAGAWMSVSPLVHELAVTRDGTDASGRLHHVCFWYGVPQHVSDAAELFREHGIQIEAGPGKHGIAHALFVYVREPGGNRIELYGDAGYLIFDPAWQPVTWHEEDLEHGIVFYGGSLPAEFFTYGTPHVEIPSEHSQVSEPTEVAR